MAPDRNITCKDKMKLIIKITYCCIIDTAWVLIYKPGNLIHLKIFFMVVVTQEEPEIGRCGSEYCYGKKGNYQVSFQVEEQCPGLSSFPEGTVIEF